MSLVLTGSTHIQLTTLVSSPRRRGISCLQASDSEHVLGCTHASCARPDAGSVGCLSNNVSTPAAVSLDGKGAKGNSLTHVLIPTGWSYLVVTVLWLPKAAVPSARAADPDSSAKYCGKSLACSLPKVCLERFLQGEQVPQIEQGRDKAHGRNA